MRGAFRIGSVGGIQIRVHFTLLLILPVQAFLLARQLVAEAERVGVPPWELSGHPLAWGLGLALALFFGVLLHELAHAFYALYRGGKVRGITLLMIGGVSEVIEPPRELRHEAVMALVGPLVSLILGVLCYALFLLAGGLESFNVKFTLYNLAQINLLLGLFNLLPAFPMDGGRILRAVLATRMGMARGTRIAATLGKVFAGLFALLGLYTFNFLLLFIAYFVFIGAENESRQVLVKALLGKTAIREMMTLNTASVDAADPVARVAERMLSERRLGLPVVEGGQVLGVALLRDVQAIPPEQREQFPARDIVHETAGISPDEDVWQALRLMEETGLPQVPVVEDGRLVGVLRRDDVARGLQLQELAKSQRQPRLPLRPGGEVPA